MTILAFVSWPFSPTLLGVLTRRVNRQGATAGVIVGIAAGLFFFLETNLGWGLLASPYLKSFLHRAFIADVLSAAAMAIASLVTPPPPREVAEGSFYLLPLLEAQKVD